MSEKRFKLSKINPSVNPFDTVYFIIDFENPSNEIRDLKDCCDVLNGQQATINKQKKRIIELEQRDYDNQSERYKILGRAIELSANYIKDNDLEYCNFCGLVTEFENELLEGLNE